MTERWLKRLSILDEVDPPDDLVADARRQEPRSTVVPERGRPRVVVILTAFTVFLAAGAFAYRALAPSDRSTPPASTGSASASEGEDQTYTDPLGWSLDYPKDWHVLPIDSFDGRVTTRGAAFSNVELTPSTDGEGQSWPDLSELPRDGVVLIVVHHDGGPAPTLGDDSAFPLDPSDAGIIPGPSPLSSVLDFRGDGLEFTANWGGYADGDPANFPILDQIIRAIRFQPWSMGEQRNGFTSFGSPDEYPDVAGYDSPVEGLRLVFVVHAPGGFYVLDPHAENCPSDIATLTWDPDLSQAVVECGSVHLEIRYERDGSAVDSNPEGFRDSADIHPVIRAWDGSILVAEGWTLGSLPDSYWG